MVCVNLPQALVDPALVLETTSGAWVLLTRTELILLMTVNPRLCRICTLVCTITPLCRQLKLNLEPALQATLVVQVGCPLVSGTLPRSRLILRLRKPQSPFTYLELCSVRQLPIAMTRMLLLVTLPRQFVSAEISAPFLFAPTLVTAL